MTDLEKIAAAIKGQIAVANEINSDFITLTKGKGKKILEILNQQEQTRCKDCKSYYKGHCQNPDTIYWCRDPDWYCADGERKTEDA